MPRGRMKKAKPAGRRRGAFLALAEALEPRCLLTSTPTVTLSIYATAGNWTAYASDSTGDNLGLAAYAIDVVGSGGLTVTGSQADAPEGSRLISGQTVSTGFDYLLSNGDDGLTITAAQNILYGASNNAATDSQVYLGLGQTSGSEDGVAWLSPLQIASGTYSGTAGTLSVNVSDFYYIESLKNNNNGSWAGPGNVSLDTVIPGSATVPPALTAVGAISLTGTAGLALSNVPVATFTDADGVQSAGAYSASINWGDSTTDSTGTISIVSGQIVVNGSHTYATNGTYQPVVTLTDSIASGMATGNAVVANPLASGAITISPIQGRSFSGSVANVTDANLLETVSQFQASITWGDGTVTSATVTGGSGSFVVSGTHTYLVSGSNSLSVSISDAAGNASTALPSNRRKAA